MTNERVFTTKDIFSKGKQHLLQHYDRISDAPNAIPRLRRFILDLAVKGKLLKQNPDDESASELFERLRAEKKRLIQEGKNGKQEQLCLIEEEETPFKIPSNWIWVRLKNITSYIQRGKSPKYSTDGGLPVVSQRCVQWNGLDMSVAKLVTRESVETYGEVRFLQEGDLLWNSTGTGTIGRIIRITKPPAKLVCDSHVTVVRCLGVNEEYVRSWLRSDYVYGSIEDRAVGSTNQVELTSQMAANQLVPLPPLAEQHRIVAKVDELMALCDALETQIADTANLRNQLLDATLFPV